MTRSHESHLRSLYAAVSDRKVGEELTRFFHPDAEQIEYPSLMRPTGHRRSLAEMAEGAETGLQIIKDQRYDVHTVIEQGERVAIQLTWTATTTVDLGAVPAGTHLVSHVAAFYEFLDGLVLTQSSYDCYQPVPTNAPGTSAQDS